MDVIEEIKNTIKDNSVLLFMKGTPDMPQCGFSMRTAEAVKSCGVNFGYVDVLAVPEVRENLPKISTFHNCSSTVNWSAVAISYWTSTRRANCKPC